MTTNEIIERLLEMEREQKKVLDVLATINWDLPQELYPDYCELALDMLGYPPDQTRERPEDGFSRDYASDIWDSVVRGAPLDDFIAEVEAIKCLWQHELERGTK